MLTHLTKKPGEFKAFCKLGAWRDVADVLALDPPLEGAYPGRWNKSLERNEQLVPCDFETTEPTAFEAHMRDLHDRRPGWKPLLERGWDNGRTPTLKPRPAKPSPGRDGQPFKTTAKNLKTCPTCGLVAEVRGQAGELWWSEHVTGCALATSRAAS